MESYNIIKFGIFDDFAHTFGKETITNVLALNRKELIVSTTQQLYIIEKNVVKKKFPLRFSTFTIVPENDYLIATTIKESDLIIYKLSDFIKNKSLNNSKFSPTCIEKISTSQNGITHIYHSPKSNVIITIGIGIKVFSIKSKENENPDEPPTITITKRSSFSPNYSTPTMTPPAFDKETELILLPTENGIFSFDLSGAKICRCSKYPATLKTIYATYPTSAAKLTKLISIPSTSNLKRDTPTLTKEILTYDLNEGMNLWGSKGQLINHYDTIRSSVLSIIFIDSENAICINSCNILFYLNIRTGKTFYYMNLEKSPSRLFLTFVKNQPILCACFGSYLRVLKLVIPWRVWNLNLEKTFSLRRCNKFSSAARILIDAENSPIKFYSPRNGEQLCVAKTNESIRPVSSFYDRGIVENYCFNEQSISYEPKITKISDRDTLFIVLQNGQIIGFNPFEKNFNEVSQFANCKASFMTICRFRDKNDFKWGYSIASEKGELFVYDYDSMEEIMHFIVDDDVLKKLFFDFDSNCFILVFSSKTVLFDVEKGKIIDTIQIVGNRLTTLFSNFLVYGFESGHIRRVGIESKRFVSYDHENKKISRDNKTEIVMKKPHSCPITGFSFAQKIWISAGLDGNVVIWNYDFKIIYKIYLPLPLRSCLIMNGKCEIIVATATEIMQIKNKSLYSFLKKEERIDNEIGEIDNFDQIVDDFYRNKNDHVVSDDESYIDDYDDNDEIEIEEETPQENNKQKLNRLDGDDDNNNNNGHAELSTDPLSKLLPNSNANSSSSSTPKQSQTLNPNKQNNNSNNNNKNQDSSASDNKNNSQKVGGNSGGTNKNNQADTKNTQKKPSSSGKDGSSANDKNQSKPADKNKDNLVNANKNNSNTKDKNNVDSTDKSKGSASDKDKSKPSSASDKEKSGASEKDKSNSNAKPKQSSGDKNAGNKSKDKTNAAEKDNSTDKTKSGSSADKTKPSSSDKTKSNTGSNDKSKENANKKSNTKSHDNDDSNTKDNEKKTNKTNSNVKHDKDSSNNDKNEESNLDNKNKSTKKNNQSKTKDSNSNENDDNNSEDNSNTNDSNSASKSNTKNNKVSKSDADSKSKSKENTSSKSDADSKSKSDKINDSKSKENTSSKDDSTNNKSSEDDSKNNKISNSDSKSDSTSKSNKVSSSSSKADDSSKTKSDSSKINSSKSNSNVNSNNQDKNNQSNENNENNKINNKDETNQNNESTNKENVENKNKKDDQRNEEVRKENNEQSSADDSSSKNDDLNKEENENKKINSNNNSNENDQLNETDKNDQANEKDQESIRNEIDQTNKNNENNENDQDNEINKENQENDKNEEENKSSLEDQNSKENDLNNENDKIDQNNEANENDQNNENDQLNQNQNEKDDENSKNDQNIENEAKQDNEADENANQQNEELDQANKDNENINDLNNENAEMNNENDTIENEANQNEKNNENQDQNEEGENPNEEGDNQNENQNEDGENPNEIGDGENPNEIGDAENPNEIGDGENQEENENQIEDGNQNENDENKESLEDQQNEAPNDENNVDANDNDNQDQANNVVEEVPFTGQYVRVPPPNVVLDKEELFNLYENGRREFKPLVEAVAREEEIMNNWHLNLQYVQNMTSTIESYEEFQKQKESVKGFTLNPKSPKHAHSARARRVDSPRNDTFITSNSKALTMDQNSADKSLRRTTKTPPVSPSSDRSALPRIKKLYYPASYVHNYNNNYDTQGAIATPRLFGRFSNVDNMIEEIDSDKNNEIQPYSPVASTPRQKIQLPPLLYSQPISSEAPNENTSSPVRSPAYNRTSPSPRRQLKQTV